MNLEECLPHIDRIQARRFARLTGIARSIADRGIRRHLLACARNDLAPDVSAIREIIDDAIGGRAVYEETGWEPRRGVQYR